MKTPTLASTPANPTVIEREIGYNFFSLNAEGLHIILGQDHVALSIEDVISLRDFLRSPGVAGLISRAWRAELHAYTLAENAGETVEGADDAGRKAA